MQISSDISYICDALTGLPMRSMLEDYYGRLRAQQAFGSTFLCIIDIDRFKSINDTYGHIVGDEALKMTARWLSEMVHRKDYICRFGGDEFLLLLVDCTKEEVEERFSRFQEHAIFPIRLGGERLQLSYSIGIVPVAQQANYHNILQMADDTLYRVKRTGRGRIVFCEEEISG